MSLNSVLTIVEDGLIFGTFVAGVGVVVVVLDVVVFGVGMGTIGSG